MKILAKITILAIFSFLMITSVSSMAEINEIEIKDDVNFQIKEIENRINIEENKNPIPNPEEIMNNEIILNCFDKLNNSIYFPTENNQIEEKKSENRVDKIKNGLTDENNYFGTLTVENVKVIWKDINKGDLFSNQKETHGKRLKFVQNFKSEINEVNINIIDNTDFSISSLNDLPGKMVNLIPINYPWKSGEDGGANVSNIELIGASMGGFFLLGFLFSSGSTTKYASLFFPIPLYSRIKKDRVLENKTREDIYTFVSKNPGSNRLSIKTSLSLANGSTGHHLRTLEREGYIKSIKDGRFRKFFVSGTKVSKISEMQNKIAKIIENNPGIMQIEIASKLKVSRQTVNYHVKYLADKGLVQVVTSGRKTTCHFNKQAS